MKLTIDAGDASMFVQSIRAVRASEPPRTGVHVSTIVNDIVTRNEGKTREPMVESLGMSFQEMGNVIEDLIADMLTARFPGWVKPSPQTHDGLICSPDGWTHRSRCIDEVKALWKSTKDFVVLAGEDGRPRDFQTVIDLVKDGDTQTWTVVEEGPKFAGYMLQLLSYMFVWRADRGRLHLFFVNGNYRPPFPEPITLNIRPGPRRVAQTYRMVRRHGVDMGLLKGDE